MAIPDPMDDEKIDHTHNALSILPEESRISRVANGIMFGVDESKIVRIPSGPPDGEEAFLATSDASREMRLVLTRKRKKDSFWLYLLKNTRLRKIDDIGFSELPRIAVFPNGTIIKLPEVSKYSDETKEKYGAFTISSEGLIEKDEELSGELESLFHRYGEEGKNWTFTTIKTLDFDIGGVKLYLAGITNEPGGVLRYAVSIDDGSRLPKTGLYLPDYRGNADFLANAMGDGFYYMLYHKRPSEKPVEGYSGMRLFGKDRPLRDVAVKKGNEEAECFFHGRNRTAVFVSVVKSTPGDKDKNGEKTAEIETSDFLVPYSYIKEIAEGKDGKVVLELNTLRERFAVDMNKTVSRHSARGERYEPVHEDPESGIALFRENPYYNGPYCFYDGRKVYTVSYEEILTSHSLVEVSGSARGMESIPKRTSYLALTLPPDENGDERMVIFAYRASFPNDSMSLVAVFEKSKLGLDENKEIFNFLLLENGKKKGLFVLFSTIPDERGFNVRTYEFDAKGENGEISIVEIGRDSMRYLDPFFQIDAESKKISLSVSDHDGRRSIPIETDASFLFGMPDETNDMQPSP